MPIFYFAPSKKTNMPLNFEFKARANDIHRLEEILLKQNPLFIGEDSQTDTYFHVGFGRLKLREGIIENALIHYERTNTAAAKESKVLLYRHQPDPFLKEILKTALGIKTIVDKKRKIYFIDNVKFHFDEVKDLGTFVEVEAIDKDGSIGIEKLKNQCAEYIALLHIDKNDFIAESYSDLLLAKKSSTI